MLRDHTITLHGSRFHYTEWWTRNRGRATSKSRAPVHTVPGDQPEAFTMLLREFLDR